jgi:hypothetical protein
MLVRHHRVPANLAERLRLAAAARASSDIDDERRSCARFLQRFRVVQDAAASLAFGGVSACLACPRQLSQLDDRRDDQVAVAQRLLRADCSWARRRRARTVVLVEH